MNNIVHIHPRRQWITLPAAIDERVPIIELIYALAACGLTLSNRADGTLVIHRVGDKP